MRASRLICLIGALCACATDSTPSHDGPAARSPESEVNAPATQNDADAFPAREPPPGYMRYEPEPIMLDPGGSGVWAQWVSGPLERDMDVVDIRGSQTVPGHHAVMYSTLVAQVAGFTREWADTDQLTTRFMGGVGGEGGEGVQLPDGVVFRVPAGSSLMVQTHYINAGDTPVMGRSYLDVKWADPSPDARVAVIFASGSVDIAVAPMVESGLEVACELPRALDLLMFTNHMHETGHQMLTTATLPDGSSMELKRDDAWEYEWQTNPNYTRRSADDPLHLPAGTRLDTRCIWQNPGDRVLNFPDEMCIFIAFAYGTTDISCIDGAWLGPTAD